MSKSIQDQIDSEEGFTLIELMVVVLIIGILMAIAIPTFLGAKNSANARAAQSNLRNAITAEQSYFTDNAQQYGTGAALTSAKYEPAIAFSDAGTPAVPTSTGNAVVIEGTPGTSVELAAKGADNKCYYVTDVSGQVAYYTDSGGTGGTCTATPIGAWNGTTALGANSKGTLGTGAWGSVW